MAYAGAEFATKVIRALAGGERIVTPSYVHLDADKDGGAALKKELGRELDYFSSNVQIGVNHSQHLWKRMNHVLIQPCDSLRVSRRSFPLES
jgi:hypothetical protein